MCLTLQITFKSLTDIPNGLFITSISLENIFFLAVQEGKSVPINLSPVGYYLLILISVFFILIHVQKNLLMTIKYWASIFMNFIYSYSYLAFKSVQVYRYSAYCPCSSPYRIAND